MYFLWKIISSEFLEEVLTDLWKRKPDIESITVTIVKKVEMIQHSRPQRQKWILYIFTNGKKVQILQDEKTNYPIHVSTINVYQTTENISSENPKTVRIYPLHSHHFSEKSKLQRNIDILWFNDEQKNMQLSQSTYNSKFCL